MNESETRAEYIDPKLKSSGWGEIEGSKVLREFRITEGKIQTGGMRGKPEIADYILVYKNRKIGVVEAKAGGQKGSGLGGRNFCPLASLVGIFVKKSSNINQKAPPIFKIKVFSIGGLGVSAK